MNSLIAVVLLAPLSLGLAALPVAAQPKQQAPQKQGARKNQAQPESQKTKVLGVFGDWQALTYKEVTGEVCYAASLPKKSENHQSKPGETNILVTHWPAQKNFGVVSVTAGYDYKKNSPVELLIGKEKFSLFTQGKSAWAKDGEDGKIVKAFKAGREIIVEGVSAKGAKTKDVYSLSGFGKAYEEVSKACGVKG